MSDMRSKAAGAARMPALLPEGEVARLVARLGRAGFQPAEIGVLHPVEPFLELSGEEIRRRLFVTADEAGDELCLRPEFTIPAALAYLKGGVIGRRVEQVFAGPVFRHRPGETGEFLQISLESIGRTDREAADADILAETFLAVSEAVEGGDLAVTIGDLGLFAALIGAMSLDAATARKLVLALGEGRLAALLDPGRLAERKAEPRGLARYPGVLDALKGADPDEARAFVKDLLSIAGISATGGRSAEDIARRFLDRAREEAQALGAEQAEILRRFLAIEGEPDEVAQRLRALAAETGLDLGTAIDRFDLRTGFLEARGLPLARIQAGAGFSRSMDYYSGFVFDIRRAGAERPIASGGRYDRLFERLGHDVPAIGAAIWVDRLAGEIGA
ncbi:MAG: ATP phosphoribosyltransferase regulatory subunit [Hyphomicrobiales bacterium]|nr:ATP phosphoribosyltransferase regulatory subunit [Hyphomicrobiales bacterium]MCA1998203.1 ATP phosphoribosyltransferase regulatory subunit [Hyphomicrobiales bacterium]